jgi:hypothetical protein
MYLIFIDDILIFCDRTKRNLEKLQAILELFCKLVDMLVNEGKSTISSEGMEDEDVSFINKIFPFKWISLNEGLKYLGFMINPNKHVNKD